MKIIIKLEITKEDDSAFKWECPVNLHYDEDWRVSVSGIEIARAPSQFSAIHEFIGSYISILNPLFRSQLEK